MLVEISWVNGVGILSLQMHQWLSGMLFAAFFLFSEPAEEVAVTPSLSSWWATSYGSGTPQTAVSSQRTHIAPGSLLASHKIKRLDERGLNSLLSCNVPVPRTKGNKRHSNLIPSTSFLLIFFHGMFGWNTWEVDDLREFDSLVLEK